jgi:hypothetical protein
MASGQRHGDLRGHRGDGTGACGGAGQLRRARAGSAGAWRAWTTGAAPWPMVRGRARPHLKATTRPPLLEGAARSTASPAPAPQDPTHPAWPGPTGQLEELWVTIMRGRPLWGGRATRKLPSPCHVPAPVPHRNEGVQTSPYTPPQSASTLHPEPLQGTSHISHRPPPASPPLLLVPNRDQPALGASVLDWRMGFPGG